MTAPSPPRHTPEDTRPPTGGGAPIAVRHDPSRAERRYDWLSPVYELNAWLGSGTGRMAIRELELAPGHVVLELGAGTGRDLLRLADGAGGAGHVLGVDVAAAMLRRAGTRVRHAPSRVSLLRADAGRLPLAPQSVDAVLVSRLLDLIDAPAIPAILAECTRVLRPGGRIALVHMSKPDERRTLFERLYAGFPGFGGTLFVSRPVLAAPFLIAAGLHVSGRRYVRTVPVGSEIVWGVKPDPDN